MTRKFLSALLAGGLVTAPGLAQSQNGASVSVQAGPLQGSAGAGQADRAAQNRAVSGRRDADRRCERVTVRSGNGSSSASASASVSSSGGSTALAAGGSPDARTEFSDCSPAPTETREASSGRGVRHEDRP
jgi:hypothetical protein